MRNKVPATTLLLLGLLLTSCAQIKKIPETKTESPNVEIQGPEEEGSIFKEIVRDTHEELQESPGQLIGSAQITRKHNNKKEVFFLYGAEHLNLKNYYFDIPVVYNKAVQKWMNYFLSRGKDFFIRYTERAGRYAPVLAKILDDYGLPRDLIFLAMAESGFQNHAKSWAKAVGPWQFMPYTGKRYGLHIDWYVDERRDPIKASIAAARFLNRLYDMFGSWELAAAGYNAGPGKISRAIKRYRTRNFWKISRGRYLKPETKNYVPKIMALAIIGKNLESFGLNDIDYQEPLDFDEVTVPGNTDLYLVAEDLKVPFDELKRYNPELLRWITPPDVKEYKLRLPAGTRSDWASCCEYKDYIAKDFMKYEMRSNATLAAVTRKFKIKGDVLAKLNNMPLKTKLKKSSIVLLPFREDHNIKHNMYADLYEKPARHVRRRKTYRNRIRLAKQRGKKVTNPSQYYVVRRGDTLWTVSRRFGVSLDTLIRSNLSLVSNRMIRAGDRLVIR